MTKLIRGLSLPQAVALNMIDMVGIGPFVSIPIIIVAMNGPQCILAWVLGAVLSFVDGCVWAELGAKWPQAGGSYAFLQNLYGKKRGRLFSFLFIWQTVIQAPLVVASGAIGFAQYLTYLVPGIGPNDPTERSIEQRVISGALVILITVLLYRKITDIGKISVFMGIVVGGTILWLIFSGVNHFDSNLAFTYSKDAFDLTPVFFFGLGQASIKTVYSFLGYYNVCHLGAEIKEPEKNIPRSIFISIAGIAALYFGMQIMILGVIPWQEVKDTSPIVSMYFEKIYGDTAAQVATILVLCIASFSLFAVILGYSRIPYAAAVDGNFFSFFGKLHPTKNFPYVSLLILGGIAFVFSLLFKMKEVITAILTMRILIQFIGQGVGLLLYHHQNKNEPFPFRMWLYPAAPIIAIAVWLFIFFSADWYFIKGALGLIAAGVVVYFVRERRNYFGVNDRKRGT